MAHNTALDAALDVTLHATHNATLGARATLHATRSTRRQLPVRSSCRLSSRAIFFRVGCATFDGVLRSSPLRSRPSFSVHGFSRVRLVPDAELSRGRAARPRHARQRQAARALGENGAARAARPRRCLFGAASSALPPRRCLGAASAPISARPRRCDLQPRRGLGADLSAVSARRPPTSAPASVSTSARAASARPRPARPRPHFLFVCKK